MNIKELERALGAKSHWDGEGHVFVFENHAYLDWGRPTTWSAQGSYEEAQRTVAEMMRGPKAGRPRGWSRGTTRHGDPFVKVLPADTATTAP
jgi:hypothetical protein